MPCGHMSDHRLCTSTVVRWSQLSQEPFERERERERMKRTEHETNDGYCHAIALPESGWWLLNKFLSSHSVQLYVFANTKRDKEQMLVVVR